MDDATTTVVHLSGPAITFDCHVRQRCSWCGYVIEDTDLHRVEVQTREDGTPGPWSSFPFDTFLRVTTSGGFTGTSIVPDEELVGEDEPTEEQRAEGITRIIRVPDDACMRLPYELTLAVASPAEPEHSCESECRRIDGEWRCDLCGGLCPAKSHPDPTDEDAFQREFPEEER